MEKIARSINKSNYVITVRINALNNANFISRSLDIRNRTKLIEFNDKLLKRLGKFCNAHPLRCDILNEPDYFLSDETNKHTVTILARASQYPYNDTLKHLWDQLFAVTVVIENNKDLLEYLDTNSNNVYNWYLYSINLIYKNIQRTILLIQKLKPELLYPATLRYEKLSITEVKLKNLPKLKT